MQFNTYYETSAQRKSLKYDIYGKRALLVVLSEIQFKPAAIYTEQKLAIQWQMCRCEPLV